MGNIGIVDVDLQGDMFDNGARVRGPFVDSFDVNPAEFDEGFVEINIRAGGMAASVSLPMDEVDSLAAYLRLLFARDAAFDSYSVSMSVGAVEEGDGPKIFLVWDMSIRQARHFVEALERVSYEIRHWEVEVES